MDTATIVLDSQDITVGPGVPIQVTQALPHEFAALRPTDFKFADPEIWEINEFMIGNRSQLERAEPIPATDLALPFPKGLYQGSCDTIQTRMQIVMIATHHGEGKRSFRCEVSGPAARLL